MYKIDSKVFSHRSLRTGVRDTNAEVRLSKPLPVNTFQELVAFVAEISFQNSRFNLMYRGQSKDYSTRISGTTIDASIYRLTGSQSGKKKELQKRYSQLNKAVTILQQVFRKNKILGRNVIEQYPEMCWAILQHYEVLDTPVLDVTHSLRAACSFALGLNNTQDSGIVHVLGLPYAHGAISFYPDEQLLILRLLGICPPGALRPYYQEGYLIGTFPGRQENYDGSNLDFARRLIAKFRIPKSGFWSEEFPILSSAALYPESDPIKVHCDHVTKMLIDGNGTT